MTDTLIAPAAAATATGAAVVVEADGRTASNDALHAAIEEAVGRGAPLRVLTTWGRPAPRDVRRDRRRRA